MDGERPGPGQPAGSAAGRGEDTERAAESAPEAYGPLALERHRKDDGRALILYRRREPQ